MAGMISSGPSSDWLVGGGEMEDLIRSTDWSTSPLGPRERWPQALCTTLAALVESKFPMALLWGRELVLLYNDGYRAIAGERHPQALGRSTREIWPEVWHINQPIIAAVMERGESLLFEDMLFPIVRGGRAVDAYFTIGYSPVRLEDRTVGGALVVLSETTTRVARTQGLEAAEARLTSLSELQAELLAQANDAILASDDQFRLTFWNAAAETMYGWKAEEVLGRRGLEVTRTEWKGHDAEAMRSRIAKVGSWQGQVTQQHRDGARFPVEINSGVLRGEDGRVRGYVSVNRDISERLQLEEALRRSEERYRTTLYSIGDGVIAADAHGAIQLMNRVAETLTGWTEAEARGRSVDEVFVIRSERTGTLIESPLRRVIAENAVVGLANHTVLVARDGSEHSITDSGAPICDDRGQLVGAVLVFRDQTAERTAERALIENEARFRVVFEHSPVGRSMTGVDGSLRVNQAFCDFVGYSPEELRARKWQDITQPEDIAETEKTLAALIAGTIASARFEKRYIHKSGRILWAEVVTAVHRDENGQPSFFITTVLDITARKRMEEEVRHLNRALLAIRNVNQLIAREKDAATLIRRACEILTEPGGYVTAWIALVDEAGGYRLGAAAGLGGDLSALEDHIRRGRLGACARAISEGGVHVIQDPAAQCPDCPAAPRYTGHAALAARLEHAGRVAGLLVLSVDASLAERAQERDLVSEVADDLAFALHGLEVEQGRKRLEMELRRHHDELERLVEERTHRLAASERRLAGEMATVAEIVREMLRGDLSDAETERQVLRACLDATESTHGMIGRLNQHGRYDVTTYSSRALSDCAFPEALAWEMTTGMEVRGLWGATMLRGKPVLCNDLAAHPDRVGQPAGHVPITCFLGVPVFRAGKVAGMVAVANKPGGYTTVDEETLVRLVDVMSVSRQHRELLTQLEERVAQRTTQLEESNRELEAFSYSVSHDLRAPLRAIDGFTRILANEHGRQLDEEGRRVCGIIRSNTERMGRLIEDLLAFSRLGRIAMEPAAVDMAALARSVMEEICPPERRQRIDFQLGELPPAVADPSLMRQVWQNLLGNAVKFSGSRERAVIQVSGERREQDILYTVSDNGAGFDMRYAHKLFRVFERLHGSLEFEGTGVGLALVAQIVRRHRGRVWAEGEVDKGAKLFFTLPRKEA